MTAPLVQPNPGDRAHMTDRAASPAAHARGVPLSPRPTPSKPAVSESAEDLLTVAQVLAKLKIPRRTWQRWRELGIGPTCIQLPNRELRIRPGVLDAWLRKMEEAA
jgi:hypothetical protein